MSATGNNLTQPADNKSIVKSTKDPFSNVITETSAHTIAPLISNPVLNQSHSQILSPIPTSGILFHNVCTFALTPYFKAVYQAIRESIYLGQNDIPAMITDLQFVAVCRNLFRKVLNSRSGSYLNSARADNDLIPINFPLPAAISNVLNTYGPIHVDESALSIVPQYQEVPAVFTQTFTVNHNIQGAPLPAPVDQVMTYAQAVTARPIIQRAAPNDPVIDQLDIFIERLTPYYLALEGQLNSDDEHIEDFLDPFDHFVNSASNNDHIKIGFLSDHGNPRPNWILPVLNATTQRRAYNQQNVIVKSNFLEPTQDDIFIAAIVQDLTSKKLAPYDGTLLRTMTVAGAKSLRKLYATEATPN